MSHRVSFGFLELMVIDASCLVCLWLSCLVAEHHAECCLRCVPKIRLRIFMSKFFWFPLLGRKVHTVDSVAHGAT